MKVTVYRKDLYGREKAWKQFMFIPEESLYETKEIAFAHYIWDAIIKQKYDLGNNHKYCRDYFDYDNTFNRLKYDGEGIYNQGKKIVSVEHLRSGIKSVELDNRLYFIE